MGFIGKPSSLAYDRFVTKVREFQLWSRSCFLQTDRNQMQGLQCLVNDAVRLPTRHWSLRGQWSMITISMQERRPLRQGIMPKMGVRLPLRHLSLGGKWNLINIIMSLAGKPNSLAYDRS